MNILKGINLNSGLAIFCRNRIITGREKAKIKVIVNPKKHERLIKSWQMQWLVNPAARPA